jgi:hypothetical protein
LCNIVIQVGICLELVRPIKMCLNGTYSRVQVGKNLSDMFRIEKRLKYRNNLSPFFYFALVFATRTVQVPQDSLKLN